MQEKNKFFKFIWRFNAIVILFVGIISLIGLSFISYKFYEEKISTKKVFDVVNTQEKSIVEKLELQGNGRLVNNKYLFTTLVSTQDYNHSYYSKSSNSIRNYLFTDIKNSNSSWLFKKNNQLILNINYISKNRFVNTLKDVRYTLLEVIKEDSNEDRKLSRKDNISLFVFDIKTKEKKEVLSDIKELISWQIINENELFILYKKENEFFSSYLDLLNFTFKKTSKIPKI